jgi:glycopeptide antibiotics resistance protein
MVYSLPIKRNRILYLLFVICTIGLGLASRARFIPELIYPYLGDVLYALMIFWTIGFLFPQMSSKRAALISILTCFLIEFSQLYHAEWIDAIRRTRLGGLILGFGFLWSDLVSYAIGGMMGCGLEYIGNKRNGA